MSATGRWFRIYEETLDDPRLQRLPASLFRAWVNLLCVASRCGGALPGIEEIAFMLRSRPPAVAHRIEALKAAGLIEERDGTLVPTDWERRQFVSANDRPSPAEPMTAAERTRRWREKRARDAAGVTGDVTVTAIDLEPNQETKTQTAPAARESATDVFDEFWQAFPSRDGDNPEQPALDSFRKAVAAGADPKAIIAGAKSYAGATAGRERRYIASAARWLSEGRWRGAQSALNPNLDCPISTPAPGVWISATSPEWRPWADHWRATKGKSPPIDAKGGWRFPSLNPPEPQPLAA
jgi:hypothetical protein